MTKSEEFEAAQRARLETPLSDEELDEYRDEDARRGTDDVAPPLTKLQEQRRRLLRYIDGLLKQLGEK